ncbi:anaerobic ribonucleoside-triphosphate reductase activating protein [Flavobacterium sediminilitoris]|uniref:Anaerobic ribonucleoside-triphosphate reductase activating protein n=1 Tax=Flavobacterium sediminilitoris TaxID=2024526 RepID=A0ABY4HNU9_9FLAO|nr:MULTISPECIES: anaerobic ribonucleoside-triphosphate reductase activating protein [Flavobacterium]UOX33484.1 anaerobic ribonucleoside-triphosphate reductase activating protein [Flavobacterium sediminilitoris]
MLAKSISNITPFTLLDYPHKSACILWYAGCNMRCLYCYNPEIVLGKGTISFTEVISFLKTRIGLLNAVVFSGGECLIHKNILEHIELVKKMGFLVKIDTNGSSPKVLKKLLDASVIDYVALDYKALPNKFKTITKSNLFVEFEASFELLKASKIPYEIRTTYHSELCTNADLIEMQNYLNNKGYTGNFYVQNFSNGSETLSPLPRSVNLKKKDSASIKNSKIIIR